MNVEKVKEYLLVVMDMEQNLYIQEKVLDELDEEISSLGRKRKYDAPVAYSADVSWGKTIGVTAMCFAVAGYMINFFMGIDGAGLFGFISLFFTAIKSALAWLVVGFVVGLVIALIKKFSTQAAYDQEYKEKLQRYDDLVSADNARVKKEIVVRNRLEEQRQALEKKYIDSYDALQKIYAVNIVSPRYRGIIPISSIYQYLCDEKTFSLGFDRETGDQGAYNIFDYEVRLDLIINKLDDVINKLDSIIDNQRELATLMRDANKRIDRLSSSVKNATRKIEASINNQTAIQAYNAERQIAEQRYLNSMVTWDIIDRRM